MYKEIDEATIKELNDIMKESDAELDVFLGNSRFNVQYELHQKILKEGCFWNRKLYEFSFGAFCLFKLKYGLLDEADMVTVVSDDVYAELDIKLGNGANYVLDKGFYYISQSTRDSMTSEIPYEIKCTRGLEIFEVSAMLTLEERTMLIGEPDDK